VVGLGVGPTTRIWCSPRFPLCGSGKLFWECEEYHNVSGGQVSPARRNGLEAGPPGPGVFRATSTLVKATDGRLVLVYGWRTEQFGDLPWRGQGGTADYSWAAQTWVYMDEHPDSINDAGAFPPDAATNIPDAPGTYHNGAPALPLLTAMRKSINGRDP